MLSKSVALMLLNACLESGNDCQTHIFYGKMCPKTELVESKGPGGSCLSISLVTGFFQKGAFSQKHREVRSIPGDLNVNSLSD
jgi:hypothetical protein